MRKVVLKHYFSLLRSQESDRQYYRFLYVKIIPLIRFAYPSLVKQWDQEKTNYFDQEKQLKISVLVEVSDIFERLKSRLDKEKLLDNLLIEEKCRKLKSILEFFPEKDIVLDVHAQQCLAVERLKCLCYAIVDIKREDLVEYYVEEFIDEKRYVQRDYVKEKYQCNDCFKIIPAEVIEHSGCSAQICPQCGGVLQGMPDHVLQQVKEIKFFDKTKFVPSFFKLIHKKDSFLTRSAGFWEILCIFQWCWQIKNRDYFRKELHYMTAQACARSVNLLNLNCIRSEVRAIKKNKLEDVVLLRRERVDSCLDTLANKLFEKCRFEKTQNFCCPEAIEIELSLESFGDLLLKIIWSQDTTEICRMHSFHDDESLYYKFLDSLVNNPGVFVPLRNAKKYLREAGIVGILRDLFVQDANKNGAILKSKRIILLDQPIAMKKELCKAIQRFRSKSFPWE